MFPPLQAALQLYRVVLGLEVLGNPVGFVKGLKDGTVGLFYHPIQVFLEPSVMLSVQSVLFLLIY